MKKLITSSLMSFILCSSLFAQLSIQNGSFENPADGLKYRADASGTPAFNGNVPGWWADANATDCGRHQTSKGGSDGLLSGYGYNNDNGGSIWALAGTVETGKLKLDVSFYSKKSYSFAAAATPTNLILKFATYEGTEPSGFVLLETLKQSVVDENSPWVKYDYTYTLPESAVGKNLLIGFDLETVATEGIWYLFDNFTLSATDISTGINTKIADNNITVSFDRANSSLIIQNIDTNSSDYTLISAVGKKVLSGKLNVDKSINVSGLSNGIYILNIDTPAGQKSFKTIIR